MLKMKLNWMKRFKTYFVTSNESIHHQTYLTTFLICFKLLKVIAIFGSNSD